MDWFSGSEPQESIKGLYLYGGVGCGKTFVMDLFYACVPIEKKRRSHFHSFMLEIHQRLHLIRKSGKGRADVATVAEDVVRESGELFCFDEFNVTDVGDAVILRTLFDKMWECGAVVVSTSNRRPDDLYLNGIQRDLFKPCIHAIKEKCVVHHLDSETDFRLLMTHSSQLYIITGDTEGGRDKASKELDRMFTLLSKGLRVRVKRIMTQGREIRIPQAAGGIAIMDFSALCSLPTGAADFLAISRAFHTLIVKNIPFLSMERLPEVRRMITLIDVLYDHHVKLLCSAAAEPFELFKADRGASQDEAFAFDRTASRLMDMMSDEYKAKPHRPPAPELGLPELQVELITKDHSDLIWNRYDSNGTGFLEVAEIRLLLEDLRYAKQGHRNVSDETVQEAMRLLDADQDGHIRKDEFDSFVERTGYSVWYL